MDIKVTPKQCPKCNMGRSYCKEHDAYFCSTCDEWLEDACRDPSCEFCPGRPDKPSQVNYGYRNTEES